MGAAGENVTTGGDPSPKFQIYIVAFTDPFIGVTLCGAHPCISDEGIVNEEEVDLEKST